MSEHKTKSESEIKLLDESDNEISPKSLTKNLKSNKKIKNYVFLVLWVYLFFKLFLFDIDLAIVNYFGLIDQGIYVSLRLIFVVLIVLFIWFILGNKRFWKNIGLLLIFPLYPSLISLIKFIFWDIPKYLLKRRWHIFLYYYIENILLLFFDFKYIVLRATLIVLGIVTLNKFSGNWLILTICIFSFLILYHLTRRFKQIFSPIRIFRIKLEFDNVTDGSPKLLDKVISQNQDDTELDEEKRKVKEMEAILVINEFAKALNIKLKEVINTRIYMLTFLAKSLMSYLLVVLYFGAINYALFLINPSNFKITNGTQPSYFDFLYYSFFTLFVDSTGISPETILSQSLRMAGVFVGVIINILLFIVYFTVSNERFKENLTKLSLFTELYTSSIHDYFKDKYGINPSDGLKMIKKLGSSIESTIQFIRQMAKSK